MDPSFSFLHPNPGWSKYQDSVHQSDFNHSSNNIVGKHCILELYECDSFKLNDEAFVRTTINLSVKFAGAKLLNLITHKFEPKGVTGLALLAESHISIHTWPDNKYAAVDVFTCGNHTMPEIACNFLKNEFQAKSHSLRSLKRYSQFHKSEK